MQYDSKSTVEPRFRLTLNPFTPCFQGRSCRVFTRDNQKLIFSTISASHAVYAAVQCYLGQIEINLFHSLLRMLVGANRINPFHYCHLVLFGTDGNQSDQLFASHFTQKKTQLIFSTISLACCGGCYLGQIETNLINSLLCMIVGTDGTDGN